LAWLSRARQPTAPSAPALEETEDRAVEQAAPGIRALLESADLGQRHSVLDLGPASEASFSIYGRCASRIRFADLLSEGGGARGWSVAQDSLPAQPEAPYDLVFGWNVLDRLSPKDRPILVRRLVDITASDAWLHLLTSTVDSQVVRPLRFSLVDLDRIRFEPDGALFPAERPLLPADVERLLHPFQVIRAFTLKSGFREYATSRRAVQPALFL
jgi:hypothetical protein